MLGGNYDETIGKVSLGCSTETMCPYRVLQILQRHQFYSIASESVRQGNPLSPKLFTAGIKMVFRNRTGKVDSVFITRA